MTENDKTDEKRRFDSALFTLPALQRATLSSVQFLSRIPLPGLADHGVPEFKLTAHTFPLAGLLIALPSALFVIAMTPNVSSAALVAIIVLAITTIITGALHEDGLADVADGFWGGHDREQKLAIMRDSTIGVYGMLALLFSVLLRAACIAMILANLSSWDAALIIIAIASLSRASMIWPWVTLDNARPAEGNTKAYAQKDDTGLSARYGEPDRSTLISTAILCLPALALLLAGAGVILGLCALLVGGVAVWGMTKLTDHHIGGHTGDTLGATQQIVELGLYIGIAVFM